MSHAGSFPNVITKLTKDLLNASAIVIEIRPGKPGAGERIDREIPVVAVNGFSSVNEYAHYIASLTNCFLEDTRDFLFTLPAAERPYFLERLISRVRRFEKMVVPIDPSNPIDLNRKKGRRNNRPAHVPCKRIPRRYHDPHLPFSRWVFRSCEIFIPNPEEPFKTPVADVGACSVVTGKAWKYSTAWCQQLWNARNELEELKRFAEWLPLAEVHSEASQHQQPKLPVSATRDVLGAFFRVLKESNAFGNTPPGEICKMVVAGFSTKNCTDLQLKRFRNIFDVPTPFALECCCNEFRNYLAICEKLMHRYGPS
ncbi:MAG: hypothetical protein NTW16_01830 [Bacteroidetes bacterium]|nr:hypothetical protein [Bacteroidota bacterium]